MWTGLVVTIVLLAAQFQLGRRGKKGLGAVLPAAMGGLFLAVSLVEHTAAFLAPGVLCAAALALTWSVGRSRAAREGKKRT